MTPTDDHFRAAILAAPDAALTRLAYADFLDDGDRPHHAAALRLDAAMAAEPPWGDRYWLLKADRDAHTPAGFPGDLGWLSDRAPLLCGVPDDWQSRWRAVRAFVSRWWSVPLGDAGRWGAAVEEAERAAGRELPPGVKEWAAFLAEFTTRPWYDQMLEETGWVGLSDGPWVVPTPGGIRLMSQGADDDPDFSDTFLVPDGHEDAADPPVERTVWQGPRAIPQGRWADSVSGFAVGQLGRWHVEPHHWSHPGVTPEAAATVAERYVRRGRFDRYEVCESPGAFAIIYPPDTIGFRTHHIEQFAATRELLALGDPRTAR